MDKKEFKKLVSIYIQIILGFVGICSSFLIPLLITYYFNVFTLPLEELSLTSEELSNIDNNLTFLIASIFIFFASLIISLIFFTRLSFTREELSQKRKNFLIISLVGLIIGGLVFLIISFYFFIQTFIPNKIFILSPIFFVAIILFVSFFIAKWKTEN